jgi:hypothetical protein
MKKSLISLTLAIAFVMFSVGTANATWISGYNASKTIVSIRVNGTTSSTMVFVWVAGETQPFCFPLSNYSANAMLATALSAKASGAMVNVHIPAASSTAPNTIDFIDVQ